MIDSTVAESQVDELIAAQINAFRKDGPISEMELSGCLQRFVQVKQLLKQLDSIGHGHKVPWNTHVPPSSQDV
jgi:hypothetical protein